MKAGSGQHFEQAYNAQAAVDEAMLIVGQRVSDAPNDKQELAPTVAAMSAVLADSGFYSQAAVRAVEQKPDGTSTGMRVYAAMEKHSHHKMAADFAPAAGARGPRSASQRTRRDGAPLADRRWQGPLQITQADRRAGLWDHQRSDGVPAVPVARPGQSAVGMDAGLRELQSQTNVSAQKSDESGMKNPMEAGILNKKQDGLTSAARPELR